MEPPFSFEERPLRKINPGISAEVEKAIDTALQYNPEDRFMLALTQDFPMGNNNLFLRAEYVYASETATDGDNDPLTVMDDFGILNLRVGIDIEDWNSTITLWGRNITDEDNVLGFIDFSNNTGFVNEPRTWGIEIGYEFGD